MDILKNMPSYMYFALPIMACFFFYYNIWPIIKTIRRVTRSMAKNPKGSNLSQEDLSALSVGAINGEQTSCYIDTLTTGMDAERLQIGLRDYWGITGPYKAEETLEWLETEGHRMCFAELYRILTKLEKSQWDNAIARYFSGDERAVAKEFLNNLAATHEELTTKDGITEAQFHKGTLAWDMGRLVIVARMCYDKKYISEPQAWDYIQTAHQKCKEQFDNWDELSTSYIIGRALTMGDDEMFSGIKSISRDLLSKPESPWQQVSL